MSEVRQFGRRRVKDCGSLSPGVEHGLVDSVVPTYGGPAGELARAGQALRRERAMTWIP